MTNARKSMNQSTFVLEAPPVPPDVIEMLTDDHLAIAELFDEYNERADMVDDAEKDERARAICRELVIHATVEEEIFYPAARDALGEDGAAVLDDAEVEHDSANELIAMLQIGAAGDPLFDARVRVLGEHVRHHVEAEEGELFPMLRDVEGFDAEDLAAQIQARKDELEDELDSQLSS